MSAARQPPVLVADIGGTNARFALIDVDSPSPLLEDTIEHHRVADFDTPEKAAATYLRDTGAKPRRAVFAVAGHIVDGKVRATNSPWQVDARQIRRELDLEAVHLMNDFAAQSMCLPLLTGEDITPIGSLPTPTLGSADAQTLAVVGPGTGLGVGALLLRNGQFQALETEGGHVGYAPETPLEIELLKILTARFGHVSSERLISGNGLANLYQALAVIEDKQTTPLKPEQITEAAQRGDDALSVRAVEQFCAIFGAVAGDVALSLGAWDGVFLAGGLPPMLLPWLRRGGFRERFQSKGRMSAPMERVPSLVITHPNAGLLGVGASAIIDCGRSLLHGPARRVATP